MFSSPSLAPSLCQLLIPAKCPRAPPAPQRAGASWQESPWSLASCVPARVSPADPGAKAIISLWRVGSVGHEPCTTATLLLLGHREGLMSLGGVTQRCSAPMLALPTSRAPQSRARLCALNPALCTQQCSHSLLPALQPGRAGAVPCCTVPCQAMPWVLSCSVSCCAELCHGTEL